MSIATRTSTRRLLAVLTAASLGIAACGTDETIDAGTGPATEATEETAPGEQLPGEPTGEDVDPELHENPDPLDGVTEGFTPMTPRTDLISLQSIVPDDLFVDPADDRRVLIQFEGAAEPCAGAAITVTETEADVTVLLQTGLDPNAAAMSCVAQVFDYEIAIQLEQPLGDRSLTSGT